MTDHFNKLTPAEDERLAKLCEEAAEVIQIGMKIMRHGYESYNPDKPENGSNRMQLMKELDDVYQAACAMYDTLDITDLPRELKPSRKYMHHQKETND